MGSDNSGPHHEARATREDDRDAKDDGLVTYYTVLQVQESAPAEEGS
jgi:hypothetical protein